MAFSILCVFLTVLYGSFFLLTFWFSRDFLNELELPETEQSTEFSHFRAGTTYKNGYIGERLDKHTYEGFMTPKPTTTAVENGTLT